MYALPPYQSLNDRMQSATTILLASIEESENIPLGNDAASAKVRLQVQKVYLNKTGHRIPRSFTIQYLVWPDSVESVRSAPENGRYIVFLKERYIKISNGKVILIYTPIDPRAFAYQDYSEEDEQEIIRILEETEAESIR